MKFKKFFTALALSGFLLAGALFVGKGVAKETKVARANNVGEITIDEIFISNDVTKMPNHFYLTPDDDYDLPNSWAYAYTATAEDEGVFVNGVKQTAASLKYADGWVFCELPSAVSDGDKVALSGTFATTSDGGHSFSIHYTVQRFADTWVNELDDYDVVSLEDANMPDFEKVAINTEDTAGYGYIGYDESGYAKKFLPKQKGIFGLTNEASQSYAFQFNFEADGKMADWFTVRIGASGGWTTGHYLKFNFTNIWHDDGIVVVSENEGDGAYASHKVEVRTDISSGERTIKIGSIKVKGSVNNYYVFAINNGVTSFGRYWDLADGFRSTKVGMYAPDTNLTIKNSFEPAATKVTLSSDSTASALYFSTEEDVLPFVHTWGEFFVPQGSDNFTYNGVDASDNKWNYFKKVAATHNAFFLGFGDAGITPAVGDMLHLGGVFKLIRYESDANISVAYKVVIESCDFQLTEDGWKAINPNYEASDFAKDLLKLTLPVCSASDDNNHDALVIVWATLADDDHYDALVIDEKETLADAEADKTVVVPSTIEGIEEMLPEEAIGAAMYRYDVLTAKYGLDSFIDGRPDVPNSSSLYGYGMTASESNNVVLIIVIISAVSISLLSVLIIKKRKQK